jgi:hypothetical protein
MFHSRVPTLSRVPTPPEAIRHRTGGVRWSAQVPLIASCVLLVGALVRQKALVAVGRTLPNESWRLEGDAGYLVLAPLHGLLDQMSLLTIPQHVALLLTVGACGAMWGAVAGNRNLHGPPRRWASLPLRARTLAALAASVITLAVTLAICAWGAWAPRPMLHLAGTAPDELVIDFHAHTEASHDARDG